jgi:hypothetical protein
MFFQKTVPGLTGVINTAEHGYPKAIEEAITDDNAGHFEFAEEIYCFYKDRRIFFWQEEEAIPKSRKVVEHTFEAVITAVSYKSIAVEECESSNTLVAVAFG